MNKLNLNRSQLAKFLPNPETIKEFENLFGQNNDLVDIINAIINSGGLNSDGGYPTRSGTNYIDSSTNLYEDSTLLDEAMLELIINATSNMPLTPTQQTVLCDATLGSFSVTLPNPVQCFNNNRSFRIAIHKIDSSVNTITISPYAGELVMNEVNQSLLYEGEILNFITDGTNWYLGA